ncbi:MAG TPA: hypothetical protein VFJ07_25410 [Streptosporangiaceae bacterium]|nr:hypothetical protein [Streptosporangiaceae bacterium]
MDLDTMLTEAAPARHIPLDGPDSPAAVRLYQQITAQPPTAALPYRRRRFAVPALIGVAVTAMAVALALDLTGSPAAPRQGGVTLAAWSVVKEPHGLLKVTIRQLRDPAGLQRTLAADGVAANVRFVHHFFQPSNSNDVPKGCLPPHLSSAAIAKVDEKLIPSNVPVPGSDAFIFRPSAIPDGVGLYLKAWAPKPGTHSAATLSMEINLVQASHRCTGP